MTNKNSFKDSEVIDDLINTDWLDTNPTEVVTLDQNNTPTRVADELPGYDIGFHDGYTKGLTEGREETQVKEWLTGISQTLTYMKEWLIEKEVPFPEEIVAVIRNKLFVHK